MPQLDEREQQALMDIASQYYQESETQYLAVIRRVSKLRSLVKGDPADWYDRVGRRWLAAEAFPEYNKATAPRYNHNINLSQGWWLILQGAVQTAGIPGSTFRPQNSRQEEDIQAASVGKAIIDYERTVVNFREIMMAIYRYFYTDGICLAYVRHIKDKVAYGESDVVEEVGKSVNFTPATFKCPSCGDVIHEDAATQSPDGVSCPKCGSQMSATSYSPSATQEVPQYGTKTVPNGREVCDIYGALETFMPWWAKDLAASPFARISTEVPKESIVAVFTELEAEIMGSGVSGDKIGPMARADARAPAGGYGAIAGDNKITYDRHWFRPQCFFRCGDMDVRSRLLKKYPQGVFFQVAGNVFLDAIPEKMESKLRLMRCYKGDGMYTPSIGQSGVPIHDSVNTAWNMALEAMEFAAFAPILLDAKVLSGQGMKDTKMQPGVYKEIDVPADKSLKDSYVQMQINDVSQSVQRFTEAALPWGEFLVGAEKVLQGGPITNVRTLGGQSQTRSQALQRQASAYEGAKDGIAGIQEIMVNEFLQNQNAETYFEIVGKNGDPQQMKIELSPERGHVSAYPVASESIPQTWAQRQDTIRELFGTQSEVVKAWMNSPKNARIIFDAIGMPELTAPGADLERKYERMIPKMLKGQQLQYDPVLDDPDIAIAIIKDWAATEESEGYIGTPGFEIVKAFAQAAQTAQSQAQQAQLQQHHEEIASKESIAKLQEETKIVVANVMTKSQEQQTRDELEQQEWERLNAPEPEQDQSSSS